MSEVSFKEQHLLRLHAGLTPPSALTAHTTLPIWSIPATTCVWLAQTSATDIVPFKAGDASASKVYYTILFISLVIDISAKGRVEQMRWNVRHTKDHASWEASLWLPPNRKLTVRASVRFTETFEETWRWLHSVHLTTRESGPADTRHFSFWFREQETTVNAARKWAAKWENRRSSKKKEMTVICLGRQRKDVPFSKSDQIIP